MATAIVFVMSGASLKCSNANPVTDYSAMCHGPRHMVTSALPVDRLPPGADVATQGKAMRATIDILQARIRDLRKVLALQ